MPETPANLTRDGKPLATRAAQFQPTTYDDKSRTVTVSLGTGAAVQRWDWESGKVYTEVLSMDPQHIRLDRMNAGAPFLRDHMFYSVDAVVGRFVKGSVAIRDGELVGEVRLSKAARNADTVGDIVDGILADTSVGYLVHAWEVTRDADTGAETRTATDWEPYEGSIVPVPADPSGGVRSAMTTEVAPVQVAPAAEDHERDITEDQMDEQKINEATAAGGDAEAARRDAILALPKPAGVTTDDLLALSKDRSLSVADAGLRLLTLAAERQKGTDVRPQVTFTRDEGDTVLSGISAAVEVKAGVTRDLAPVGAEFRGATLIDMAKRFLSLRGVDVKGRTNAEIAKMALRSTAAHTTSDFPYVFANVGYKSLMAMYNLSSDYGWWRDLGRRVDFANFQPRYIVGMSGVGVLPTVAEGAEFQGVTQSDLRNTITPVKKGGELRLTIEMVANDDLAAFTRSAAEFGKACQVTEAAMALAALTATMADNNAVCSAAHSNIVTSGGTPSTARIAALDALLRNATDGNSQVIGSAAKVGLFPVAVRNTVEQIYSDRFSTETLANIPTVPLAASDRRYVPGLSTLWFLATGNPLAMEYGWWNGGPTVEQYAEEKTDSVIFHARDVFGIGVVRYQDFACDDGAT